MTKKISIQDGVKVSFSGARKSGKTTIANLLLTAIEQDGRFFATNFTESGSEGIESFSLKLNRRKA